MKNNIKKLRTAYGVTQSALAKKLGIAQNTLSYWEQGKYDVDTESLKKIADFFNCSVDCVLGLEDISHTKIKNDFFADLLSEQEKKLFSKYNALDDHGKEAVNSILDIEYNRIQQQTEEPKKIYPIQEYLERVSAGTGNYLDYTTAFITELGYEPPKEADFIVTVGGDSMEPTLYEGDRLFVQKVDCLEHGDIGIFFVPQEGLVVKECTPEGLVSHNKKYKIIKANPDIETIGKVIGKVR